MKTGKHFGFLKRLTIRRLYKAHNTIATACYCRIAGRLKPILFGLIGGVFIFGAATAQAVDTGFELDGNAIQDQGPGSGLDDWQRLYENDGGSSSTFTGVLTDPAPKSIFNGGKKDIQDISQWGHKSGAVPDKSDITNAYAAAYSEGGDLIVYFGADRVINVGDTFMGFWFFQNEVSANPNGTFNGNHAAGDTLVLVNFPQANNAVPLVQVITWDPTCAKASSNNPQPNTCAATNLRLVAGASGAGAVCDGTGTLFCAITNEVNSGNDAPGLLSGSPWPYVSKDGVVNQFPYETFFEGGINLSQVIGSGTCFTSFLAETRSSSSFTASLKDFAIGSFPVCSIDVSKVCGPGKLDNSFTNIIYPIEGTVTNEGFGTVYDIELSDNPPFENGSLVFDGDKSQLAGGQSINYTANMVVPITSNGISDTVTAVAYSSSSSSGTALTATASADCPELMLDESIDVDKMCEAQVTVLESPVVVAVQVNVAGQVCNTGQAPLTDVLVWDNQIGEDSPLLSGVTLGVDECMAYSGNYLPQSALDASDVPTTDPGAVRFKDRVTATGTSVLSGIVTDYANAECPLCE